ncbi:MAG: glutamate-5-semialdehyde dehydrogenase [Candidatus Mariimomonas ferrooxydans]
MTDMSRYMEKTGLDAKAAAKKMAFVSTAEKNHALYNIADALIKQQEEVLAANHKDYAAAESGGMGAAMLDRLKLDAGRIKAMSSDVLAVAALPDHVGEVFDMKVLPTGLQAGKKRVPLGVIGAIYESRPNVTVDISILCLKSGNAVILRGGSETINSNLVLARLMRDACLNAGLPENAVQLIENTDRALVGEMLVMKEYINLIIPRGGSDLVRYVGDNARMPVLMGGIGVCHTYVDKSADMKKAVPIIYNAKVQRPTVCNALDTVLIHREVAGDYLPEIARELAKAGVEFHCDEHSLAILKAVPSLNAVPASEEDWGKEFLALIAAVKVVDSLDEAVKHIDTYGSGHSEAIVTENYTAAQRFLNEIDAACVYVNASTRFTDGGQFGLGAEVGISTQKMHARGPMGLKELTTYKWIIYGSGQVRQ